MVGKTLGHYELVEPLGAGGMGEVYRARDMKLNRDVAIKVLPEELTADEQRLARLEREAQLLAALNHPNIATIHSIEKEAGTLFLVLELIEGESVEQRMRKGGLPVATVLDFAKQIAHALEAAHGAGIVHRDLKPANLIVTPEGRLVLLDFGIAKDVQTDPDAETVNATNLTATGAAVGTPAYMSPEQARGEQADKRADVWAFGCILYEMLAGANPFAANSIADTLVSILEREPDFGALPPATPATIRSLVRRSLQKNAHDRLHHIADARIQIQDAVDYPDEQFATPAVAASGALVPRVLGALVIVLAMALAWALLGPGIGTGGERPPEVNLRQLTTTAGLDFGGSISPDGEWFAFSRQAQDSVDIYLQPVAGRTAILILNDGASPSFSPDGNQIAFSRPPDSTLAAYALAALGEGGISIMDRTGGDVRQLTEEGFNPAWSPDGSKIAFGREFVYSRPYTRANLGWTLGIVDVISGEISELDVPDGVQPAWSPNGHRIAYWGSTTGHRDIYTVAAGGGEDPVAVTDDDPVDFSPVWSPDGEWLYWVSARAGSMAIWRVAIDEVTGALRGEPQQITTGGLSEPGMLSVASGGSRFVYTETLTTSTISAADFDPETLVVADRETTVVEGSRRLLDFDVSPDGEFLAYRTEGARQDILVARTDGTDQLQITDDFAKDWGPVWSPDGAKLAFYTNASGNYQIWTMNPDGGRRLRLTNLLENPITPVWSPDGKLIMANEDLDTYLIDPLQSFEQQEPVRLPRIPGHVGGFVAGVWHPDGKTVVGSLPRRVSRLESDWLFLYSVDEGTYDRLVEGNAPFWLADGSRIVARVPGRPEFIVFDTRTREAHPLTAPEILRIRLSPDNRRAYLGRAMMESDVWMLELQER